MLDKKEFQKMVSEMAGIDERREEIIKRSRDILKLSKQAIYDVHRNDLNYAAKKIGNAESEIKKLKKHISQTKGLDTVGAFNAAAEEWVEAKCYYEFEKTGKIPTKKALSVPTETYLAGISDLTGELSRHAVAKAIEGEDTKVKKIRDIVEDIYGQFLKFSFRNGDLRKKSDAIKWNLKKVEEVLYDMKRRR